VTFGQGSVVPEPSTLLLLTPCLLALLVAICRKHLA
jgi:hypothetical protein